MSENIPIASFMLIKNTSNVCPEAKVNPKGHIRKRYKKKDVSKILQTRQGQ